MNVCTRFDDEALARWEAGETLDAHFDTCEDCVAARAAYERLREGVRAAALDARMPDGWIDEVLHKADDAKTPGHSLRPVALAIAATVAVAVIGLTLFLRDPGGVQDGLSVELARSGQTYRGAQAKPGDTLLMRAAGDPRTVHLRVYRNDILVYRCGGDSPCARAADGVQARLTLDALGEYQPVLFRNYGADDTLGTRLDDDVLSAREAGATVLLPEPVQVR